MSDQREDDPRKILTPEMPRVSKIYLAEYIGRIKDVDRIPLPELILEALHKLPPNKRIRFKKHLYVLTSITWLLPDVPDTDSRKALIVNLFQEARNRL
jgi:hypothetical protein